MTGTMKASIGDYVLLGGVRGASEDSGASKGARSLKPALPSSSRVKDYPPLPGSRQIPRFRGPKRNWYKKHRNDKTKQPERAPQPGANRRQDHEQPCYQPQHQHHIPANVVLERPDYFNYNPSNGLHTPGRIYPSAYGFAPQHMSFSLTLPASSPMLMSIPTSLPRIGQFDPSFMSFAELSAKYHKHHVWDGMEERFPAWSPPQPSVDSFVDPFVDPVKACIGTPPSQAGYRPLYDQRSTLRPWANDFVPGRLFHPILGW